MNSEDVLRHFVATCEETFSHVDHPTDDDFMEQIDWYNLLLIYKEAKMVLARQDDVPDTPQHPVTISIDDVADVASNTLVSLFDRSA